MSEIIDALLSGLGVVGNVLDTPGALVRNTLSGRNPFAGLNPLDAEGRASGRDMLESWGILDANQEGLDWGDAAGFGAELLTDPLNLLGAGAAKNTARLAKEARAANATSDALRLRGAMPEEIARLTKIVDDAGNPRRMYHGTSHAFDTYDLSKADPDALFGPGVYTTSSGDVASSYAGIDSKVADSDLPWVTQTLLDQGRSPNVRMQYLDIRNPLHADSPLDDLSEPMRKMLEEQAGSVDSGLREMFAGDLSDLGPSTNTDYALRMAMNYLPEPTQSLRGLGFDGIIHEGGTRIGGFGTHDVAIAFDPSQVYSPWVAPAHKAIPQQAPLIAALLGHNALARGSQF